MEDELEMLGAASVGGVARDTTGDGYLNGPCPNCGTELQGMYCVDCGQSAKDMKKPFLTLVTGALGDVFAFDSRLLRTVPALLFRPGHVTRSYLDGKRMRYVPPFRMFLIASVVFFLVIFGITENQSFLDGEDLSVGNNGTAFLTTVMVDGEPVQDIEGFDKVFDDDGNFDREGAEAFVETLKARDVFDNEEDASDLLDRLESVSGKTLSRTELFNAIQKWAPRASFLMLPFFVLTFTLMHFWIRRVYIYDHVIVALHLQTFFYMAATLAIALSYVTPMFAWLLFGLSIPVYPFLLMQRSYDTHWFFNIFRTFALMVTSFIALTLLVVLVSLASANEVGVLSWDDIGDAFSEASDGFEEGISDTVDESADALEDRIEDAGDPPATPEPESVPDSAP